jgi:chloride channel protein, CIC family
MFQRLHGKFLFWRLKYIPEKNFIYFLAVFVGFLAGLAAVTLKSTVHFLQEFLTRGSDYQIANYWYLGFPLLGILITVFLNWKVFKDVAGHGITDIIYSISKKAGIISEKKIYSRMLSSTFTVGFGGSLGLEAPIAVTGSAIGSNLTRLMHLNQRIRSLMIGCGAAGGIAAIFNAPIAGVIFAMEIILTRVSINSFIPLLISSVTATLVAKFLIGEELLFSIPISDHNAIGEIPYYIALGVLCGLVSVYFSRSVMGIEARINGVSDKLRPLAGGILLGLIIFIFPPIYGEGYLGIKTLASPEAYGILYDSLFFSKIEDELFIVIFCFLLVFVKPIASAVTIGAGGSGGIFAPSLVAGGYLGFAFSGLINQIVPGTLISKNNFLLVGMCGVLSGVQYSPLTAIFLIAEITEGYSLFIPLMIVSSLSYLTASYFEPHSLYTKRLIQRGELIKDDKDRHVLSLMKMNFLIEKDLHTIHPDSKLSDLIQEVSKSKRNIFPVVDDDGELLGIVTLDDIRKIMFDREAQETVIVRELMSSPPARISPNDPMDIVMQKFESTGAWNLPVLEEGIYIGFLSKSRIFNAYRSKIRQTQGFD